MRNNLLPSGHQRGHTAAHRLSCSLYVTLGVCFYPLNTFLIENYGAAADLQCRKVLFTHQTRICWTVNGMMAGALITGHIKVIGVTCKLTWPQWESAIAIGKILRIVSLLFNIAQTANDRACLIGGDHRTCSKMASTCVCAGRHSQRWYARLYFSRSTAASSWVNCLASSSVWL